MTDANVDIKASLSSAIDALGVDAADNLLSSARALRSAVLHGLSDPTFMPKGGWLGIGCRSSYNEGQLAQAERRLKRGGADAYVSRLPLQTADSVVAAVLSSCGLQVDFQRKLSMQSNDYHQPEFVLAEMPGGRDIQRFGQLRKVYAEDDKCRVINLQEVQAFATGPTGRRLEMLGSHEASWRLWTTVWFPQDGEWVTDKGGPKCHECDFRTAAFMVAAVPAAGEERAALLLLHGAVSELSEAHVCAAPPSWSAAADDSPTRPAAGPAAPGAAGREGKGGGKRSKKAGDAHAASDGRAPLGPSSRQPTAAPTARVTAAQQRAEALNKPRRMISVDAAHGRVKVALQQGEGLRELKALIVKRGRSHPMSAYVTLKSLVLMSAKGQTEGQAVKGTDLVCGASVRCVYA